MGTMRLALAAMAASVLALTGCMAGQQDDQEVQSAVDAICCGSTCCLIDSVCRMTGERNPADMCQTCDPSRTQRAWSTAPGCGGTDGGSGGRDAGSGGGGGGCSASGLAPEAALGLLPALLGLALIRRRQSRR